MLYGSYISIKLEKQKDISWVPCNFLVEMEKLALGVGSRIPKACWGRAPLSSIHRSIATGGSTFISNVLSFLYALSLCSCMWISLFNWLDALSKGVLCLAFKNLAILDKKAPQESLWFIMSMIHELKGLGEWGHYGLLLLGAENYRVCEEKLALVPEQ